LHYWRKFEVVEWLVKARRYYRRLLRENHHQLVHAFFAFPSGWLCYRTGDRLPYIVSLRGSDVPGYNVRLGLDYKLLSGLFRRIWRRAAAVVPNSIGLRDLARAFMPDLPMTVIPNGIDTDTFSPSAPPQVSHPVRLLTVCRLISRKRIDILINALVRLREMGVDARLDIAGQGNLLAPLQQLGRDLGVADKINFLARVPSENMPELYRSSDIFLMSSAHEGMSNAMLEAMASGLPIITTQCEGVQELITDNGVVVEEATDKAIAAAIAQLAKDPQTYQSMCAAARQHALTFSWRGVAEQYVALYRSIIERQE